MPHEAKVPEPSPKKEKQLLSGIVLLMFGYMIWLTMFSRGPAFYSFNEEARARIACGSDASEGCLIKSMKRWRKDNPHGPRGS